MEKFDKDLVIIGSNEYSEHDGCAFFRSGLEQQIDDLAGHFSRAFHYSPKSKFVFNGYTFSANVEVRPFSIGHHESHRELWKRKGEYWQSIKQIHKNHPNAIFLVFIPDSYIGLIAALYLKFQNARFFVRVTAHQLEEMRVRGNKWHRRVLYYVVKPFFMLFMKWLLRGVLQIYTGQKLFYDNEKSLSIFSSNISEKDVVQTPKRFDPPYRLCYVGRFEPLKGVEYLIEAMNSIQHDVVLDVIGFDTPEYTNSIKQCIEKSPAKNKIRFVGQVPYGPELFSYYDAANVYIMPSLQETQGKTFLEAMARGAAVVASNIPGIAQIIKDGYNGFLVPIRNPEAIAKAVDSILGDKSVRERLVHNGYETALNTTKEKITSFTLDAVKKFLV